MKNEKIFRLLNEIEKAYYSAPKEPCGEYLLVDTDDDGEDEVLKKGDE